MPDLHIHIELKGEALASDPIPEIARMLTKVAEELGATHDTASITLIREELDQAGDRGNIRDINGNTVGSWSLG